MSEDLALTDHEGTLLALVLRVQPVTAYQISRIYENSPVSNFNTSKGKLYPLVRRLRERGLLQAELVTEDARRTERLSCTPLGREAVREWTMQVRPVHLLLEDPMRTKVQSFDLLSREEQIAWILEVKSQLLQKLADVEAYGKNVAVPYQEFVHDNAIASLRGRMDWLDRMLLKIAKD